MSLDKAATNQAAREETAKKNAAAPLEPGFPYVVESFDPFFFGLDQEEVKS
jgi:hypothetical protein